LTAKGGEKKAGQVGGIRPDMAEKVTELAESVPSLAE